MSMLRLVPPIAVSLDSGSGIGDSYPAVHTDPRLAVYRLPS